MRKIITAALLMLTPIASMAQGWSLEQCINYAIENNIQIKQGEINLESQRLNQQGTRFGFLPTINGSTSHSTSYGRSLDPTTYQFVDNTSTSNVNSSISAGITLFGGFEKHHNVKKSDLNFLAAFEDVQLLKNDISLSIAGAYLQILFNGEQITISENQIRLLTDQVARIKKLVDAGSVAMGTQLDLEAQLSSEEYNIVTYQNAYTTSLLTLTQLLELRETSQFQIVAPDVVAMMNFAPITAIDQVNDVAQELPQIKGSKLKLRAAELDVSLARAKYYPTLNMGFNYGSSYSDSRNRAKLDQNGAPVVVDGAIQYESYPFWDQYGDNASRSITFSLQVPIFNGLNVRRGVRQAKLAVQNSEYTLQAAQNKLFKDIQQAHNDATGAMNRCISAKSSLVSNQESFRYASIKFDNGAVSSIDYITALNNLTRAESALNQAQYEYIFRVKILDFYQGVPLTL